VPGRCTACTSSPFPLGGVGGNPADFGHASVAEQNQVFQYAYAQFGTSPWGSYDGC
jgi:hypothetical protein